jgi:hypothetical protein
MQENGLKQLVTLATRLTPQDKIRLIERLVSDLERHIVAEHATPRRSLYGICADLGSAPSAEEIDEARREAWASFPREDAV